MESPGSSGQYAVRLSHEEIVEQLTVELKHGHFGWSRPGFVHGSAAGDHEGRPRNPCRVSPAAFADRLAAAAREVHGEAGG